MMKNKSVMNFAFSKVPRVNAPRSTFNRSHGYKTTFDADWLIPFYVDEVLPGDTFNFKASMLTRLNSQALRPFMDNVWIDTFYFFVPNRLLWENFQRFMGEQDNPGDSISFVVPQVTGPNVAAGGIPIGHLYDYMGIPVGPLSGGGGSSGITFNNLHGRAYNQIWNWWFRDENLQNGVKKDIGNGGDTFTDYNLLKRGKRFDYFTGCLPNPQKGNTAVSLPLGLTAPVISVPDVGVASSPVFYNADSPATPRRMYSPTGQTGPVMDGALHGGVDSYLHWSQTSGEVGLLADLSSATSATINTLRQSITLQQFLERDARGGTRYPELIVSHFGVTNPDSRVQIPELLATYSSRLNLTPVSGTNQSGSGADAQGRLAAFGTGASINGFTKSFSEHGVLLGLVSVRADLTYQQGIDRMWNRRTRYDFFWPVFSGLGEQAVQNREIYANLPDGTGAAQKDGTFGYIPRYDEYRFKPSKITSNMRSYNGNTANANTLDIWHVSEAFASQPTLAATFIQSNTPLDRVVAVPSAEHFIMDAYIDLKCSRVMPVYGVPGLKRL